jgi:hypothetical protein
VDENGDEKLQWLNFFMNIGNKLFFVKTKQKKHDGRNLTWSI